MSTPLSDPGNVQFFVVDDYVPDEDGFTDDEVQRILNGQPLVASAAVSTFHLPGQHDQEDHASRQGKSSTATAGKKIKITHGLVHKKHEPGTVIAVNKTGDKRAQWDGKKYLLQSKNDDGTWSTDDEAIKSKAYVKINAFDADWHEPSTDEPSDATPVESKESAPTKPEARAPNTPSSSTSVTSSSEEAMLAAYSEGYTVKKEFGGGLSGSKVELLELSNGQLVVRKTMTSEEAVGVTNHGNTTPQEYLGGRVFNAINQAMGNDDDMTTARVNGNTILTTFASGSTAAATAQEDVTSDMKDAKKRSVVETALKRQVKLQGGKEIAMLDFLTRNTDRHSLNWIVEGDRVRPVDQGFAFVKVHMVTFSKGSFENIPGKYFVEHWFKPRTKSDYSGNEITPKYTRAEVERTREAVGALKPVFESEGKLDWYDQLMARFALIEESVKK